jgi:DNA polymerase III epsilon subunit family exonuclease
MATVPAKEASFAVIDTETTGLSYKKGCRVLEVAVVHIDAMEITSTWSTLINPGDDVDPGPVDIHRITKAMLSGAPDFSMIAGELINQLDGRVLVAHNASFDLGFLKNEFLLSGISMPEVPHMCTKEGSRFLMPNAPSHRLGHLCESLGIDIDGWHAAEDDTVAAAKLHLHLLNLVPVLNVEQPERGLWPQVAVGVSAYSRAA